MSDPQDPPRPGTAVVTGDPAVDAAVALLEGIEGLDVDHRPAVFDRVHRALADRLSDVEA